MTHDQFAALIRAADALRDAIALAYLEERVADADVAALADLLARPALFLRPDVNEPVARRPSIPVRRLRDAACAGFTIRRLSVILGYSNHAALCARLGPIGGSRERAGVRGPPKPKRGA